MHTDDPTDGRSGTKRTVSAVMAYLGRQGHDVEALWAGVQRVVAETARAMAQAVTVRAPAEAAARG